MHAHEPLINTLILTKHIFKSSLHWTLLHQIPNCTTDNTKDVRWGRKPILSVLHIQL